MHHLRRVRTEHLGADGLADQRDALQRAPAQLNVLAARRGRVLENALDAGHEAGVELREVGLGHVGDVGDRAERLLLDGRRTRLQHRAERLEQPVEMRREALGRARLRVCEARDRRRGVTAHTMAARAVGEERAERRHDGRVVRLLEVPGVILGETADQLYRLVHDARVAHRAKHLDDRGHDGAELRLEGLRVAIGDARDGRERGALAHPLRLREELRRQRERRREDGRAQLGGQALQRLLTGERVLVVVDRVVVRAARPARARRVVGVVDCAQHLERDRHEALHDVRVTPNERRGALGKREQQLDGVGSRVELELDRRGDEQHHVAQHGHRVAEEDGRRRREIDERGERLGRLALVPGVERALQTVEHERNER